MRGEALRLMSGYDAGGTVVYATESATAGSRILRFSHGGTTAPTRGSRLRQ